MSKVKLKHFAQSLAFEGLLEVLEGALIEFLKDVTPQTLYEAIKNDTNIWTLTPRKIQRSGDRWVHKLRKFKDKITSQLVFDWLMESRFDLASLIYNMGPTGRKYLDKQTENIKDHLWPPEKPKKKPKLEKQKETETPPEPEKEQVKVRYL